MKKIFLFIIIINLTLTMTHAQTNLQQTVTVETLKQILDAFNRHDLDSIMGFFADDCSFDFPRGPEFFWTTVYR